ncbi:GNAT family N-acetyltransferase [Pseudoroseomonas wenyumeiae]|uniref:N-acetyltransferase n=1 Tax=Teichococcus wenyumeiae TaxID=2478470 RepID=A0A3A9JRE0_9PROT|nr:GNAT family N-acetyltransferase [Pseudoroseomonas wenyumeiae]RKK03238.1 N-acetyltransferase [Pseudoroseomonas wenyumeiae]RMI26650.1 GNAT family N-acetyltransferase [Pseudoroseomonas wenyumeiae]
MADNQTELTLRLHPAIAEIAAPEWDACAGDGNPFVSHAFLLALEESGSASARTGWLPQHAALRDPAGRLVAVAPAYAKGHSYGEYVFDHAWANAFERAGGRYYPKLQVASPFSPVPGPRLLVRDGIPQSALAGALAQATEALDLSSCHVTFCTEAEWNTLGEAGWLRRLGTQFHWHNNGYADFEGFLAALSSRKRKQIRRERRDAQSAGLTFRALRGAEITPRHWKTFHKCYMDTVDRKWGSAYLTARFWPLLAERLGDRVVLMVAERDGEPVAGALNLMGKDALYGRNWGALVEAPFLHFELCYYQAIDFAIAHGLSRVEAGAQGEHKIQRGYLPSPTYSAHFIPHGGLRRAVAEFLEQERPAMLEHMAELASLSPFRQEGD